MRRLACATAVDLFRRPSTRLAIIAAAALVALLPLLPAPGASARDQTRLTLELGATTSVLIAQTLAAATAVAAAQTTADRGATAEMNALPLAPIHYFLARAAGIAVVGAAALLVCATAALIAWPLAGVPVAGVAAMWPIVALGTLSVGTHATFGLAAGRFLRQDAAYLIAIAAPWLPVGIAALGAPDTVVGVLQGALPPATGLLHPRGFAFLQPVPLSALPWRIGAALLQATAWAGLCAASAPRARSPHIQAP